MKHPHQTIKTILLTEKGTRQTEKLNQYLFEVLPSANKLDVKRAIEKHFGVTVLRVNTLSRRGKNKRLRSMKYGRTADTKRAIVTLKKGDAIQLT